MSSKICGNINHFFAYSDHISAISSRDQVKGAVHILCQGVFPFNRLFDQVNFIAREHTRRRWAVRLELIIPFVHVLVCDFECHVENKKGSLRLEEIGRMDGIEDLLSGCVPDVN
jgi:hypothetical protein